MEKQTSQPETKVPHQKPEISEYMANKMREEKKYGEKMVRLMSEDIEGAMKVYPALTKINGVSWSLANATCHVLKIDKIERLVL